MQCHLFLCFRIRHVVVGLFVETLIVPQPGLVRLQLVQRLLQVSEQTFIRLCSTIAHQVGIIIAKADYFGSVKIPQ